MKKMTVVFDDDDLYTAVKVEAARQNRPAKEIVAEALEVWLQAREDVEDAIFAEEAMTEYRQKGGIPWEQVKTRMRAILAERGATKKEVTPRANATMVEETKGALKADSEVVLSVMQEEAFFEV